MNTRILGTDLPRRALMGTAGGLALARPVFAQEDATAIAKDAWIYAYAMLMSYGTMYRQTVDRNAPEYVGGFNTFRHYAQFFTSANHDVVTPNNDTPYSWAWLDLRAEPMVLSVPAVEADRYYVCHYFDLFTHNFAIFGTRTTGREAGNFLFAGPGWNGTVPPGIRQVFRPETQIIGTVTRTALHRPDDIPALRAIQAGYRLQPLSAFTGTAAPPPAPAVDWLPWDERRALGPDFVSYLNLLLRFYPDIHPSETALFQRFARIGIGGGRPFDLAALPEPQREAVTQGAAQGAAALRQAISTTTSSLGLFGTREDLGNDYMKRAVAAAMGLYGLSKEEAVYVGDDKDGDHRPLDGAQRYTLRFERENLPPASIFWSATVYGMPDRFLVANPINRYSLGDRSGLKAGPDGSVTIYLQASSPGPEREANWLPVPASGGFNVVLRMYGPSTAVQTGQWHMPPITRAG
ncbi:DUF1254 domain-containing protein [Roseococcus pinisoli]|uniref:DUF1254 domain-containing protein n=1 Tax=Roseococcus pinisoli TaxID=2835040 RepID=A0ABS5QDT4_9PROT|nr:DUF1254 domain-containing protein [Roseococcus pinisoli]MBS7811859.1 DUF1254 domain-containing protein [Roseococcus pinisoli]